MRHVDPSIYRAALDRIDVMKKALRQIANQQPAAMANWCAQVAREALQTVDEADAWDSTPLDANGIPVPPSNETEGKPT